MMQFCPGRMQYISGREYSGSRIHRLVHSMYNGCKKWYIYNEVIDIRSAVICLYDLWDDWVNISFFIFYFNSFIDRVEGGWGGGGRCCRGLIKLHKHKIDEINDIERYIMLNRRGISPCWQIDRDDYKDLYICGWQNRDGVCLQTIPGWQKVFLNTILTFKISCLNKMFKISAAS